MTVPLHQTLFSCFIVTALIGCGGPLVQNAFPPDEEDIESALTPNFGMLCHYVVTSPDGEYLLLDKCPDGANPGRLVRYTLTTGHEEVVMTYPKADRLSDITASKGGFAYTQLQNVNSGNNDFTAKGWKLSAASWDLVSKRTFSGPPGTYSEINRPMPIQVLNSGTHFSFLQGSAGKREIVIASLTNPMAKPLIVSEDSPPDWEAPDEKSLMLAGDSFFQIIQLTPAPTLGPKVALSGIYRNFEYNGTNVVGLLENGTAFQELDVTTGKVLRQFPISRPTGNGWEIKDDGNYPGRFTVFSNNDFYYAWENEALGLQRLMRQGRNEGAVAQLLAEVAIIDDNQHPDFNQDATKAVATTSSKPGRKGEMLWLPLNGQAGTVLESHESILHWDVDTTRETPSYRSTEYSAALWEDGTKGGLSIYEIGTGQRRVHLEEGRYIFGHASGSELGVYSEFEINLTGDGSRLLLTTLCSDAERLALVSIDPSTGTTKEILPCSLAGRDVELIPDSRQVFVYKWKSDELLTKYQGALRTAW